MVSSSCSISDKKMIILSEIILNYARLSISKYGSEINIKCHEVLIENTNELVIDLSDNITNEELQFDDITDFYTFEIFKNKNKWGKMDCLFLSYIQDSKHYIRLVIKKDNNSYIESSLNNEQLSIISSINKKIILIIDDSLTAIKMIFQKIINLFIKPSRRFSIIVNEEWSNVKFTGVELDDYHFLFCSNGQLGYDVAIIKECYFIITDVEMPVMDGIEMINKLLEYGISSKIFISSSHKRESINKIKDIAPEKLEILPKACPNEVFIEVLGQYFN